MRAARASTNSAKMTRRISPDRAAASWAPISAPVTRPATSHGSTETTRLPSRQWARAEDRPVMTMVASELPTAMCMATSMLSPWAWKIGRSMGTTITPPPIPNRPETNPTTAPAAI